MLVVESYAAERKKEKNKALKKFTTTMHYTCTIRLIMVDKGMKEKKQMTKKEKIGFIMSYRHDEIKSNDTFYRYLFKEYLKMDNEELNIEFNYYYNN